MHIPDDLTLKTYEMILTDSCNLRCTYCFDNYFQDRNSIDSKTHSMNLEEIDNILDFIKYTSVGKKPDVIFFGGEPLMNFKFMKKFVDAANLIDNFKFHYSLNINATLLNSEVIDFLRDNRIGVSVSLDGKETSHNMNRINCEGSGTWEKTVKHLPELSTKLRQVGINPQILMVVNNKNHQYLVENYEFINSLGFGINILLDYSEEITEEYFNSLREQMLHLFVKKKYDNFKTLFKKVANADYIKNAKSFCHTPQTAVSISPRGNLYMCHQFVPKMTDVERKELSYGNIYEGYINIDFYDEVSSRVNVDEILNNYIKCSKCEILNSCKGNCFAGHYFKNWKIWGVNDSICKFNYILNEIREKLDK